MKYDELLETLNKKDHTEHEKLLMDGQRSKSLKILEEERELEIKREKEMQDVL